MAKKTLRTVESQEIYENFVRNHRNDPCALCEKASIHTFTHWRIVKNDFPYDKIAEVHDLLVTTRHVSERDLNMDEFNELRAIKESHINEKYEYMIEATVKNKSIPEHSHIHLITTK